MSNPRDLPPFLQKERAFEAFHRNDGEIASTARKTGQTPGRIKRWAKESAWAVRHQRLRELVSQRLDQQLAEEDQLALEEARLVKDVVAQIILECLDEQGELERDDHGRLILRIKPKSFEGMVSAYERVAKLEQLLSGKATDRTESRKLSDEDLNERQKAFLNHLKIQGAQLENVPDVSGN